MMSSIKEDLKSFKRSWVHHTGMQLATLSVLAATFSVIAFFLTLSLNLNRVLASWGDGVQITVYLHDDLSDLSVKKLQVELQTMGYFKTIELIPREAATANFKKQMASYAPDLLADADFSNPFPSSFRLSLKGGVATDDDVKKVEGIAAAIQKLPGVEDVSYGQSWVKNYSSFVSSLYAAGGVLGVILVLGSLFVVGNSIRASIAARREEIEILELVGATSMMIRRPYVIEGMVMGALAALTALTLCFGLHVWEKSAMASSLVMSRLVPMMAYLDFSLIAAFVVSGALLGAFGAWLSIRKINDGWSAKQGLEA